MGTTAVNRTAQTPDVRTSAAPKVAKRYVAHSQTPRRRKPRFLKPAVEDWLREHDGRAVLLKQAGALADDESLPKLVTSIYARRGRPETAE